MTPERIAELKSLYDPKYAPWGSGRGCEAIQECLTEIQRLQAALPTPAKELSSEYVKAVELAIEALEKIEEMLTACPSDPDPVHFSEAARKIALKALAALKSHPTPAKEPSGELEKAVGALFKCEYCGQEHDALHEAHHNYSSDGNAAQLEFDQRKQALAAYRAQVTKEGADGK